MSSDSKSDLPKVEVSFPEQNFEGPLDLLLSLIQKHELDILNIPIAFVTEKYLEFIRVMQLMNLDLASEYLVMAATLAHIKSKMLLPQVPEDQEGEGLAEEEEDPREALIRRLLEYQKYKLAAAELRDRSTFGQDAFLRGAPLQEAVDPGLPPLAKVPLFSLVEAFQRVLDQSRIKITHDVVADRVSLSDRINQLVDFLRDRKRCAFEELFTGVMTREGLVITFLALLEMAKLRLTRLYQTESLGAIMVELADGAESPFSTTEGHLAPPPAEQPEAEGPETEGPGTEEPETEGPEAEEPEAEGPAETPVVSESAAEPVPPEERFEGAEVQEITDERVAPGASSELPFEGEPPVVAPVAPADVETEPELTEDALEQADDPATEAPLAVEAPEPEAPLEPEAELDSEPGIEPPEADENETMREIRSEAAADVDDQPSDEGLVSAEAPPAPPSDDTEETT